MYSHANCYLEIFCILYCNIFLFEHTANCLWHNRSALNETIHEGELQFCGWLHWTTRFPLDSSNQRELFLLLQYNNPAMHSHCCHCSCSRASSQIMQTGSNGKPPHDKARWTNTHTHMHIRSFSLFFSVTIIRSDTFNLFISRASALRLKFQCTCQLHLKQSA